MNGALIAAGVLAAAFLSMSPTVGYSTVPAPAVTAAQAVTVVSLAGHRYAYAWQDGSPVLVGRDGSRAS